MLKELTIYNFRCYEKSTIFFNGTSILVGKNNAGKSTLIEALKIISSVTRKYRALRYVSPPYWVPDDGSFGVCPNVDNMNISDHGIFNMYGDPPAIIEALFTNGTSIKAYVGEGLDVFAVIYDKDGYSIDSIREAKTLDLPVIEVLPQISAVLDAEKIIKKSTVDGNRWTRLASRNFRNQLFYYREAFPAFKNLVESTWDELQVKSVESVYSDDGNILEFYVRVRAFEAELGWMGHGLQMWIQTMWFISQCPSNAIVVLDEPDVYMHADLQRRLVRLVTPMFSQLIIATHSLEIIEEVPSDCIIPIDSQKKQIKPIGDESSLAGLSEELGSPLNIDLARLFISNRFIIWDGAETDRAILSAFQSVLYPQDLHPIITYPKSFVRGWKNWSKSVVIAGIFSSNKIPVELYCISNSGYHTLEDIEERKEDAIKRGINLHVWTKNEIDNYAINIHVILRYLEAMCRAGQFNEKMIIEKTREIISSEFETIVKNTGGEIKKLDIDEANYRLDEPLNIISGKAFFNNLSIWTREVYGVSISARQVVPYFSPHEVPDEMRFVIESIMKGNKFL
jgi:predicted ATPase